MGCVSKKLVCSILQLNVLYQNTNVAVRIFVTCKFAIIDIMHFDYRARAKVKS